MGRLFQSQRVGVAGGQLDRRTWPGGVGKNGLEVVHIEKAEEVRHVVVVSAHLVAPDAPARLLGSVAVPVVAREDDARHVEFPELGSVHDHGELHQLIGGSGTRAERLWVAVVVFEEGVDHLIGVALRHAQRGERDEPTLLRGQQRPGGLS